MDIPILLIPAYKPGSELLELINKFDKDDKVFQAIVIVNDGNGIEYDELFKKIASDKRVTVLQHATNLGKGAALKTGFNHILVTYPKAISIVTADADGQHAYEDILAVARSSQQNPNALIVGCRQFGKDVPLRSRIGNIMTKYIYRAFTGIKLSDTQTGLRAWPRELSLYDLKITTNGYDFEMESLIQAKQKLGKKFQLIEVPIQTIYKDNNIGSHFNPILDSMRIYFVFIRYSGTSIITALIDNFVFIFAFGLIGSVFISQIYGRLFAMVFQFIMLRKVVFFSHALWYISLIKYVAAVIFFGIISYSAINYMHLSLGISVIAAKLIAETVLFIASFTLLRSLVFTKD